MTYEIALDGSIICDGWTIPKDDKNADYLAFLSWVAAGNTPSPALRTREELVSSAWAKADAIAQSGADNNSRSRYLAWMITGSEAKKVKIQAVQDWMDAIWTAYAIYKANPVGEFSPPTDPCPYDFWQIANTP